MRVLVTGGTGFLGSHSVKALRDAGHEVRLLVRRPDRIAPALEPLGVDGVDHAVGDITDADSVARALDGCDAVVHAASAIFLDRRRAAEMLDVNPRGTANVLRSAHEWGLDPIVHVSSNAALMPLHGRVLAPGVPLGNPPGAYSQSKVASERVARELQDEGAPVVIVNPVGLLGPHDPHLGDFMTIARDVLLGKMPLAVAGAMSVVDVRDVAAVHAALMEPGRGPRRYVVAAGHMTLKDLAAVGSRLTGRRIRTFTLPDSVALGAGRVFDVVARTLHVPTPFSYEGAWFLMHREAFDASAVELDLGVSMRPVEETLEDAFRWLVEAGHVNGRRAGRLAAA